VSNRNSKLDGNYELENKEIVEFIFVQIRFTKSDEQEIKSFKFEIYPPQFAESVALGNIKY